MRAVVDGRAGREQDKSNIDAAVAVVDRLSQRLSASMRDVVRQFQKDAELELSCLCPQTSHTGSFVSFHMPDDDVTPNKDRLESLVVQNNDLREKLALADSVLYRLLEPSAEPSTRSFSRKGLERAETGRSGMSPTASRGGTDTRVGMSPQPSRYDSGGPDYASASGRVSTSSMVWGQLWGTWSEPHSARLSTPQPPSRGMTDSWKVAAMSPSRRSGVRSGDARISNSWMQRLVLPPNSTRRLLWDVMSFLVIFYDIIVIALAAFNLPDSGFFYVMKWITCLFWSSDLVASFFVGYHDGGVVELRPPQIARRYLRTWLPFDILMVAMDWIFLVGESSSSFEFAGVARIGKSMRLTRAVRVFRLVRVFKILAVLEDLNASFSSESILIVFKIFKMLVGMCLLNHFVACLWYGLAKNSEELFGEEDAWIYHLDIDDPSFAYLYTTSLHWSWTQFTPASMEVRARNVAERVYSIIVIMFALVVFSSFVSSLTQSLLHLESIHKEKWRQREYARRYIEENQLSIELASRVYSFLRKQVTASKKRIHESDIHHFKQMPEILLMSIRCEAYLPELTPHPLMFHIHEHDKGCMASICHAAMTEKHVASEKQLFNPKEESAHMYFQRMGVMEYYFAGNEGQGHEIREQEHFCEMTLWLHWRHQGRAVAIQPCELVALDGYHFRSIIINTQVFFSVCEYARLYWMHCSAAIQQRSLTDTWTDFDLLQETVQRAFESLAMLSEAVGPKDSVRHAFSHLKSKGFVVFSSWRSNSLRAGSLRLYEWCAESGDSFRSRLSSFVGRLRGKTPGSSMHSGSGSTPDT